MTKGLNVCACCFEYVEDCYCGEHEPADSVWEEADRWIDEKKEDYFEESSND